MTASSDTSHNQSDAETEGVTEIVTSATSHVTAAANPRTASLGHVTKVTNQGVANVSLQPNFNSKPVDSLTAQKTPLTSRIRSQSSNDTLNSDKLRTSRRSSKSGSKSRDQDAANRRNSLTFAKRLSRSCDSLDTSGQGQGDSKNLDFGTSQSDGQKAGKLKAHRRKGRRAVTLHNLDTKQLMLILNLQMRYLEETKQYHSQKDLKNLASPRRAITPQPSSHQPKIPQNIRSHTPQPYRRQNEISQQEKDFYAQIKALMQNNIENNEQTRTNNSYANEHVSQKASRNTNTAPLHKEKHNPYIHGQRGHSVDNVHYVTYSDNMLNLKGPKPKSRATVQDYFLPPQPLHRHNKNILPPQPIRRQKSADQSLPSEPNHRGKSAFHIVDCGRNISRSSSISSDQSDPLVHTVSTPKQKKHKNDYAEDAIRDNFQLNQSPYMFKNTQSNKKSSEEQRLLNKLSDVSSKSIKSYVSSEIPPPYTGPPSYFEFLSSCDTSGTSTSSSNQEEIYSRPVRRNLGQGSLDDKYCFEIENKNLLKSERDKNYNIRQPNLDSVYGYTETLSDVQNCHGSIKLKKVNGEGNVSEVQSKNRRHNGEHIRESVYRNPPKSNVKQCIVPEDYYTPIHKVSRQAPVYANAENVEKANKLAKHIYVHNKDKPVTSPIPNGAKYQGDRHENGTANGHVGKFAGYVYQEKNQIAPDVKYHEYEDIYDPPESDEPVLLSHRELNEMRKMDEERKVQNHNHVNAFDLSKGSPKKNKVKPYTYPDHARNAPDTDGLAHGFQKLSVQGNKPVDKPKYNIPAIVVNDVDLVEDDVFISDNVNSVQVNGASKSANKPADASHGVRSSPRGDNFESTNHITDEKYSTFCVTGQSANHHEAVGHMTRQSTNPNVDFDPMTGQSSNINGANYRTADHVTGLTSQSSESDNERQVPEGTDETSEDLVDNSSEEECAETGV